ncbi:MAG: serine hydrolase [Gammaproteobacteria bacterium]
MRVLKRLLLWMVGGLLALIVVSLLGLYVVQPTLTSRLVGLALGGEQGPRQSIQGGVVPALRVASESERTIPASVLNNAIAWGATLNSHALLVWQGGRLQLEHYYRGYDAQSITPTQSMHKSVLAMLVGIAIDQGLIASVDEPVSTYVKEWAGDDRRKITIRQVLQQASGIDFPGFTGLLRMTLGGNVAPYTFSFGASEPPGQHFQYNNINPEVMGILIQRVSGMSYSQYLQQNLWQYVTDERGSVLLDDQTHGIPITFCCLDAPARTWLRFGLLHLTRGRVGDRQVVPEQWMKEIITPSPANADYGYFTWLGTTYHKHRRYNSRTSATALHSEPFAAPDVIYFDGFGGQRVYIIPSKQLVIVHLGPMRQDWDDAILPNMLIQAVH